MFSHTNKIFKFTNNVDFSLLCSYLSIDGISFNELNERINPITDLTKDEEYVCICGDIQVNGSDGSNEMLNYMKFIPYITYKEIILF